MNTDGNLTDWLGGLVPSIVGVADWFEEYFKSLPSLLLQIVAISNPYL